MPTDELVGEVQRLVADGYREVVLTGTQLGSYGFDLPDASLESLVARVLSRTGIERAARVIAATQGSYGRPAGTVGRQAAMPALPHAVAERQRTPCSSACDADTPPTSTRIQYGEYVAGYRMRV